jgi:nucleotide-binding universal stress UspA family protein
MSVRRFILTRASHERPKRVPYASLLVHVDLEGQLGGHVSIAAELADSFRARLVGVAGWAPMSIFLAQEALDHPGIGDFHLQDMRTLLDQKGSEFCATLGRPDRTVEWRSILDFPTEAVARESRSADLVIIPGVAQSKDPFRALDPGSAILKAGRPVLVVPRHLAVLSPRRIAIAWKDAREARRAVLDALPFLQRAETVVIVEALEEENRNGASHRIKDVAKYLARHRIEIVTQQVRPADVVPINSLLRLIESENIDLLIAGAYGHSRLGEWVFGGVTRDLLAESPICCLFSH